MAKNKKPSPLCTAPDTPLKGIVDQNGGPTRIARKLGVSRQTLYEWLKRGWAPPIRAVQLETIFGVPRLRLMDPLLLTGTLEEITGRPLSELIRPD